MEKTVKAVNIKTDDFGPLVYRTTDGIIHFYQYYSCCPSMGDERHDLYFISFEKIAKGDWGIQFNDINTKPVELFKWEYDTPPAHQAVCYKVIATTNRNLHKDLIPDIPESFVSHYAHQEMDVGPVKIFMRKAFATGSEGIFKNEIWTNDDGEVIINSKRENMIRKVLSKKDIGVSQEESEEMDRKMGSMYQEPPTDHDLIEFMINHYPLIHRFMTWRWKKMFGKK